MRPSPFPCERNISTPEKSPPVTVCVITDLTFRQLLTNTTCTGESSTPIIPRVFLFGRTGSTDVGRRKQRWSGCAMNTGCANHCSTELLIRPEAATTREWASFAIRLLGVRLAPTRELYLYIGMTVAHIIAITKVIGSSMVKVIGLYGSLCKSLSTALGLWAASRSCRILDSKPIRYSLVGN